MCIKAFIRQSVNRANFTYKNKLFIGFASVSLLLQFSAFANLSHAQKKQYIFSRSTKQSNSPTMGIAGVPAFVSMPGGTRRGVYVTAAGNTGYWKNIGLRPGTVLLTLDNKVIESADAVESYLLSKGSSATISYSYVRMAGGQPSLISGQMAYTGKHQLGVVGYAATPSSRSTTVINNTPEAPQEDRTSTSELESYMVSLINKDRSGNGLGSVSDSSRLSSLARSYAEDMLKKGTFSHIDSEGRNPNDRARSAGISCNVSENLSVQSRGFGTDKSAIQRAEADMMAEPPNRDNHRGNILSPRAQYVGVGIARNARSMIMVQEFSEVSP